MSDTECGYLQWSHIERRKKLHSVIGGFTSCRARYVAGVSRESAACIFWIEVVSASKVKLEISLTTPRSPFLTWVQPEREYSSSRLTALPLAKTPNTQCIKSRLWPWSSLGVLENTRISCLRQHWKTRHVAASLYRLAVPEIWTEGTADSFSGYYGSSTI